MGIIGNYSNIEAVYLEVGKYTMVKFNRHPMGRGSSRNTVLPLWVRWCSQKEGYATQVSTYPLNLIIIQKDWSDWSIEPSLSRPAQVEQAPARQEGQI